MPNPIRKQAYKLELPKKWRIHNVFRVLLLEKNIKKRRQEFSVSEFELGNDKEYEVEAIWDNAVYANKADGHLSELYYLVVWKGYLEEKSIWKPVLPVMYLWKLLSKFYYENPDKLTATSPPINITLPMAKPIILIAKRKQRWLIERAKKCAKWAKKKNLS